MLASFAKSGCPRPSSISSDRPERNRRDDLRVALEANLGTVNRLALRRGEHPRGLAGARQENDAARHAERTRDPAREHAIDLRRRELAGDLVKDVDETPIVRRVFAHALQLDGRVVQRRARRAELVARPELRPHAAQQLGDAQRLAHPVVGAAGQPFVGVAGGPGRGDDDAHVVAPLVGAEVGQHGDVALRDAAVENDEIRCVGLDQLRTVRRGR